MLVSLDDMKQYLRVDFEDDDALITTLIASGEKLCMDIARSNSEEDFQKSNNAKAAVMYTVAYLYEHREEADHHALTMTLRSLLFGDRTEVF